ncbi:MAG TPA: glycogen debranching N-terminal domain-containing protein [Gemmatimonadaceae bacterium]
MAKRSSTTHRDQPTDHQPTPALKQERKRRVLTHGTPSVTPSIAHAVVVKNRDVFLLTDTNGDVPLTTAHHGFGLYHKGCRFLDGYELTLAGATPGMLVSTATRDYMATFELTNPDLRMPDGTLIPKETIGIRWDRLIDGATLTLRERLRFENFGLEHIEFPITLAFRSHFDDIFIVRGMLREQTGTVHPPRWSDHTLFLSYQGIDHIARSLSIQCAPPPQETDGTCATFHIVLDSQQSTDIELAFTIAESRDASKVRPRPANQTPDLDSASASLERSAKAWLGRHTQLNSESMPLRRLVGRSLLDLWMLRTWLDQQEFFAAGVPWFATLFGRDSVITALQTLAFDSDIAAHTLRILAKYQGREVNEWKDEQPGKIPHELRVDELTNAGKIPYSPYYGTVDATPLFLILIGQHAAWTGDLSLFHELRPNIERAFDWISTYGDTNGDGYVDYRSASTDGLINQGWKDSGNAIVNEDGSLATPPIALVEVQGYVYRAKREMADLFRRVGDAGRAQALEHEAQELKARFNRDFWLEDKRFFALALQADGRPAAVASSNPGQALWTGIVAEDKARATMQRLMADDLFTGWGIRTLSSNEVRYNPISYHLGTVWPHDNAIIAAGFRQHGFDDAALRVANGIFDAATHFDHLRLPELFAGFARERFGVPVHYPVACHPQAWAAGSTPLLLTALLGLVPEAFEHRLRIVRPLLPHFVEWIELRHLAVGDAHTDLRFERAGSEVAVRVLGVHGNLDVVVETERANHRVPA